MNTKKVLIMHLISVSLLYSIIGCSNAPKGTSKVTVNFNLDRSSKSSTAKSWSDKISDTIKSQSRGTGPANLTSITLKISGSDMENIVITYTTDIPSSIDIEVPAGSKRLFELNALSNTFYYIGTATAELTANVDTTLPITMGVQYSAVTITPSFGSTVPSNITSYKVSASVTDGGTTIPLISALDFTPDAAVQIPTGPNRDIIVTVVIPTGDFSGSAALQNIISGNMSLSVPMAALYTNIAVNPVFPAGTPAGNTNGTFTLTIRTGTTPILTQDIIPGKSIQVPSGDNKDIEIIANTPSVYFRGTLKGNNFAANGDMTIPVTMALYKTKLLIPEPTMPVNRMVQIDDMTGAGWTIFDFNNLSWTSSSEFSPYEIDFDSLGRIYIANNYYITGRDVIVRMDNINGGNITTFGSNGTGYAAIAIDRANDKLYKLSNTSILSTSGLDGSNDTSLSINNVSVLSIYALTMGDNGMLYMIYMDTNSSYFVGLYDPVTGNITASYQISTGNPGDVLYKPPYLYVAIPYGGDGNYIVRLNNDLTSPVGYGTTFDTQTLIEGPGIFYGSMGGPRHFVAKLNDSITIEDDGSNYDKLVSIDDIFGTNWTTYGTEYIYPSTTPGQFGFYMFPW